MSATSYPVAGGSKYMKHILERIQYAQITKYKEKL